MISRPILMLQLKSNVCPCLLSPEERTVISSIQLLSKLHIIYHEPTAAAAANNSDAGTLSSFSYPMTKSFRQLSGALNEKVGKFVSSGRFMEKQKELQHEEKDSTNMANNKGCNPSLAPSTTSRLGQLLVLDTVNGPALSMECCSDSSLQQQQRQCETIVIPLHTIAEVSPCDSFTSFSSSSSSCGIYLFAKQHQHAHGAAVDVTVASSTNRDAAPLRELCRLDLKYLINNQNNHYNYQDLDSTERDEIMEALTLLIQWSDAKGFWQLEQPPNQQQQQQQQQEATTAAGGIGQRALKMKHFAQREIEMAKKKRDRENRKARYLKESGGGLKYTAIAMANREMS